LKASSDTSIIRSIISDAISLFRALFFFIFLTLLYYMEKNTYFKNNNFEFYFEIF
jgi:hypothetical protein